MKNAKIIEALNVTINGLSMLRDELANADNTAVETKAVAETPMNPPVDDTEVSADSVDVEALKKMKYNEFKKYASQLGVDCKGTRDEIMSRVLAKLGAEETAEEVEDTVEEEAPAKSDSNKPSKKLGKSKADEPTKDEFDKQAEEIAKDTAVEDIIEALADVEVKATEKNAVEKLAYALREGLIELDDDEYSDEEADEEVEDEVEDTADEQEDEADEEVEADDDEEEITADTYTANYDPNGYNDPSNLTKARKKAIKSKMQEILDAVENEDLTEDDITSYIEDHATEDEIELLGDDYEDEDLIRFYMELIKRTIDNDGEEHEPSDPYELGDELNFCCGHELKYSKKTNKYICEVCGEEYEADED